jgi:hypothetical protein
VTAAAICIVTGLAVIARAADAGSLVARLAALGLGALLVLAGVVELRAVGRERK